MRKNDHLSIGDMSRIANLSRKSLRYYDAIGLLPSRRHKDNNYRCYTAESLLTVPLLKYYKQMGFKLEEMRAFIDGSEPDVYKALQKRFAARLEDIAREQDSLRRQHVSIRDWLDLIVEAEMVIANDMREVSVKYLEPVDLIRQDQVFAGDIKSAIINLDFMRHVESLGNEITGPIILRFSSWQRRMAGEAQPMRVMQRPLRPCAPEESARFGGCVMASAYHIGAPETIAATYGKIGEWARRHGYHLGEESCERHVVDYWTTQNSGHFVTEVLLRAFRPAVP